MKDFEKVVEALKICADDKFHCADCPYSDGNNSECSNKMKIDACEILEEMKAELDRPVQNYESIAQSHNEEIRKLNDELCRVNVEYERTQRELYEAQKELTTLRAIKATAEAFLGVKIDGQM